VIIRAEEAGLEQVLRSAGEDRLLDLDRLEDLGDLFVVWSSELRYPSCFWQLRMHSRILLSVYIW